MWPKEQAMFSKMPTEHIAGASPLSLSPFSLFGKLLEMEELVEVSQGGRSKTKIPVLAPVSPSHESLPAVQSAQRSFLSFTTSKTNVITTPHILLPYSLSIL